MLAPKQSLESKTVIIELIFQGKIIIRFEENSDYESFVCLIQEI